MKELIERLRSGLSSAATDENGVLHTWIEIVKIMDAIDALEAAQRTIAGMEAERALLLTGVREWMCAKCNTVYPGPPQAGVLCAMCPKCGGSTAPRGSFGMVSALQARVEELVGLSEFLVANCDEAMRQLKEVTIDRDALQALSRGE